MTDPRRRRKRIELAALGAAIVVAASGLTWCVTDVASPAPPPTPTPRRVPSTAPSAVAASAPSGRHEEAVDAGYRWLEVESAAYEDLAGGRWLSALDRIDDPSMERCLRFARRSRVHDLEDAILAAAARQKGTDDGLWSVFVVAATLRDGADFESQERGRRAIAWASAKALVPYGHDRIEFSRAYRAVRFGDGRLDAPGGAPVHRFRFDEAAASLARARRDMWTWCYERRVLRKCGELRALARDWSTFVAELREVAAKGGDGPLEGVVAARPGLVATLDRSQPETDDAICVALEDRDRRWTQVVRWSELTPRRVAEAVVLPRLDALTTPTVAALARIFVETGETGAAERCLAALAVREAPSDGNAASTAESAALRDLERIAGRVVPDDVRASPELEAWTRRHLTTDAAHSVGGLGARDVGAFDDDAVEAYVAGGVLWAPEQWDLVRRRLNDAHAADREGLHGFGIESEHFSVFTEVSAEFAAQASLVLDAAYEQVGLSLGVEPAKKQSVVVFKRHADYVAKVRNRSGGCWDPADNTIRTFLDDGARGRFADFYFPVLVHEAAHAALGTGVSNWPGCWMHEGIACYFERWNPARSAWMNEAATGATLEFRREDKQALGRGDFPSLKTLLALKRQWDTDDFGRETLLHYAAAESLFVHLMTDPGRRAIVDRFIAAVKAGRDPAECLSAEEAASLEKSWLEFVKKAVL